MKKLRTRRKEICHIVVFLLILVILISFAEQILKPKWYYDTRVDGGDGDTPRYEGFYKLEKNSLDYIALGPSHIYRSINPTLVYAESGYKGYVLSGSSQGMGLSYIWLKEALKYQHPKYVFLSGVALSYETKYAKITNDTGTPSKQVVNMRPSGEKLEVCFICDSEGKRWWEYLFSIVAYHGRWDQLSVKDFCDPEEYFENGSDIIFNAVNDTQIYDKNKDIILVSDLHGNTEQEKRYPIREENVEYLDKIEKMCRDHGIELVLIPTVSSYRYAELDQYIEQYARSRGLDVLHINEKTADIDWFTDTPDTGWHLNYWGNCKASNHLADYLIEKDGKREVPSFDSKWESDVYDFSQYETEALLTDKDRVISYLNSLGVIKDDSIILCAVLDESCGGYTEQLGDLLGNLGLKDFDDNYTEHVQESYISVIDAGVVKYENWYAGPMRLADRLSFTNGAFKDLYIESAGLVYGNKLRISVDDTDVAVHSRGLNIVVIDKGTGDIVSSIAIDSHVPEWTYTVNDRYDNSWVDTTRILEDGDYLINDVPVRISYAGKGTYIIERDGEALTIPRYSNKANATLEYSNHTGLANQKWIICKSSNGMYTIYSLYSHYGCVLSPNDDVGIRLGDTLYIGDKFIISKQ